MVNDYRHQEDVKEVYQKRPQHIERVHRELTLLYACMNLKKFALHHYA